MKLFESKKFDSLDDLLVEQVQDLYDAEKRLCEALPKMAEAASCPDLSGAFGEHLEETKRQVQRLEEVFSLMDLKPSRDACDAMKGLISEGEEMIEAKGDDDVRDAALIAAAQRVEHYEMAAYGTICALAKRLGRDDIVALMQATLEEEKQADGKLTSIAEGKVNLAAARS